MISEATVTHTGFAALKKSTLNKLWKLGWSSTARQWARRYLKQHFTHVGARKYKYQLRRGERRGGKPARGSYTFRKLKQQGHTRPLEFSGEMKGLAIANNRVTSTRDYGRRHLPRKANFRNPKSKINMLEELRTVTQDETAVLEKHLKQFIESGANRSGTRVTVRIGGITGV